MIDIVPVLLTLIIESMIKMQSLYSRKTIGISYKTIGITIDSVVGYDIYSIMCVLYSVHVTEGTTGIV